MRTAIKHPVPDWVKPSFVIFDIRSQDTLTLSPRSQSARMSKIANDGLTRQVTVVTDLSPEVNQSVNLNIRIPPGSVATRLRRGGEYARGSCSTFVAESTNKIIL